MDSQPPAPTRVTAELLDLLRRYDRPGPRYTSYPTAVEFHEGVDGAAYESKLAEADAVPDEPLSLYFHLPFCRERCTFCGCSVVITRKPEVVGRYLDYLRTEIEMVAARLPHRRDREPDPLGRRHADLPRLRRDARPLGRRSAGTSRSSPAPRSRSRSIRA